MSGEVAIKLFDPLAGEITQEEAMPDKPAYVWCDRCDQRAAADKAARDEKGDLRRFLCDDCLEEFRQPRLFK